MTECRGLSFTGLAQLILVVLIVLLNPHNAINVSNDIVISLVIALSCIVSISFNGALCFSIWRRVKKANGQYQAMVDTGVLMAIDAVRVNSVVAGLLLFYIHGTFSNISLLEILSLWLSLAMSCILAVRIGQELDVMFFNESASNA